MEGHCKPTVAHELEVVRLKARCTGQAFGAAGLDSEVERFQRGLKSSGHESEGEVLDYHDAVEQDTFPTMALSSHQPWFGEGPYRGEENHPESVQIVRSTIVPRLKRSG